MGLIRGIIRNLIKRPYYFVKRNVKNVIITYLVGVLPMGYSLTSLTTNVPITDVGQVIETMKNSGIANIVTGGTLQPVVNGVKTAVGNGITFIGETTGSTELINTGSNMAVEAKSWFDQGVAEAKKTVTVVTSIGSAGTTEQPVEQQPAAPVDEWTFKEYPNYYKVLGVSTLDPASFPAPGQFSYNELDGLGRTQEAKGTVSYDSVMNSAKKPALQADGTTKLDVDFRGKEDNPSGWPTKNVKKSIPWLYGRSYNDYFWNRSHLIGDALGGEATAKNAITGTRAQNVGGPDNKGGMRYIEDKVVAYVKEHKDVVVYYQVTPVYEGEELIPRYVIVNAKSSDGAIDEEIKVFNTANGWTINYTTGELTVAN